MGLMETSFREEPRMQHLGCRVGPIWHWGIFLQLGAQGGCRGWEAEPRRDEIRRNGGAAHTTWQRLGLTHSASEFPHQPKWDSDVFVCEDLAKFIWSVLHMKIDTSSEAIILCIIWGWIMWSCGYPSVFDVQKWHFTWLNLEVPVEVYVGYPCS